MSQVKIRAALETALAALAPALATAYENASFTPPAPSVAYQKAAVLFAEPDNPTFGDTMHRERGILHVLLLYPLTKGTGAAVARAEAIRAAFPRGASFAYAGGAVIIEKTPEIAPGAVDGDRWAQPVKIRFYSDVFP